MKYTVSIEINKNIPQEQIEGWIASKLHSEFSPEQVKLVVTCEGQVIEPDKINELITDKGLIEASRKIAQRLIRESSAIGMS